MEEVPKAPSWPEKESQQEASGTSVSLTARKVSETSPQDEGKKGFVPVLIGSAHVVSL